MRCSCFVCHALSISWYPLLERQARTVVEANENSSRSPSMVLTLIMAVSRPTSNFGLRHWPLPLLSSMRKWRTFFTDADPTSHRVRLWRGGSASNLFFYLFFYSFVEYVDIDTSTYLKAPGPYCGAEGRWQFVGLTVSASV